VAVEAASAGEVRAVVGRRGRVEAAVHAAEEATGLQITVYLGPVEGDPRAHAEQLFLAGGAATRPAILILVAPAARRVEVVTAPSVRRRVPDDACASAVDTMVEHFRDGDIDSGIVAGLEHLVRVAGPGAPGAGSVELPDVLRADDSGT
jgi:uncharacterized membrane protein YgcG